MHFRAIAAAALVVGLLGSRPVKAQPSTTGAVRGRVTDAKTKKPIEGVVVVVTSTGLNVSELATTTADGRYEVTNLPPGDYSVSFTNGEITRTQDHITIGANRAVGVYQKMSDAVGEEIRVIGRAPDIDTATTIQGARLTRDEIRVLAVAGGTQEGTALIAAGTTFDGAGVGVGGSTSYENRYFVDGSDVTALRLGELGTPVVSDFLEELEVITGGYNAEYGRSTGGFINAVTRSGTNELHGSVFAYATPGALVAARERVPSQTSSIDSQRDLGLEADFGADLGGPIIKDKAWFYVGVAPSITRYDTTRRITRRTDCRLVQDDGALSDCNPDSIADGGHADGVADIDPETGLFKTEQVDQRDYTSTGTSVSMLGKLNVAVAPEHQGQLSLIAQPQQGTDQGSYGLVDSTARDYHSLTTDVTTKWTSKLNDSRTEIEVVGGWHRNSYDSDARDNGLNNMPGEVLRFTDLGRLASMYGGESATTQLGCDDGDPDDPYKLIANCPDEGTGYRVGGPGTIVRDLEERRSLRLGLTQRLRLFGYHEIKAGVDIEDDTLQRARLLSGGAFVDNLVQQQSVDAIRWVQLAPADTTDGRFDNTCADSGTGASYSCDFLGGAPGSPGTTVTGKTLNWAAYLRDSWQLKPNLVLDAGVRYEEQRLRYATQLQNTVDVLTGNKLGKNAMTLDGMIAPRVGLIYDWTDEGRSKVYAHWGRFYESIPMQINDRSFGGEVQYRQTFEATQCGGASPEGIIDGMGCIADDTLQPNGGGVLFGSSGVLIAPDLKAQYLDETLIGGEYEVAPDTKVGISYQHRTLGRVIEDVSTDGASTYIIANPGEWSQSAENDLAAQIAGTTDDTERMRLEHQLELYKGIRLFDKPRRDHDSVQVTLNRRLARGLFAQASYVYSRTRGNYPGLLSYDNGQSDPNISSQYDLIELLANRNGPLPQDRPHAVKLDAAYIVDLHGAGAVTLSGRFRATSGAPIDALGAHELYGPDESFLLPRGALGRSSFEHGLDLHVGYSHGLGGGVGFEVFADLFNIYNRQGTFQVDETYSLDLPGNAVNPIVGGRYEDLIWAKGIEPNGAENGDPIRRNPNFRNPTVRYAPFSARFGARITF